MKYFSHFLDQFSMKFDNKITTFWMKINENWMKFQRKLEPILTQNQLKISYFLDKIQRKSIKINQNPDQFLYYPLLNFERKSVKSHNKFIQNQWKSMKYLAIFERKSAIFQWNLDLILAQFYPKSSQFWPNFMQVGQHFE